MRVAAVIAAACAFGVARAEPEVVMCEHSACMEYGSPDADCCAERGDGGCAEGYNFFTGRGCYSYNGALDTCCLPETCVKSACLENGEADGDCCGMEEVTSCLPPYERQLGDICYARGERRTCCVLPAFEPVCDYSQCMEHGAPDKDCCAMTYDGGCGAGFTYFHGTTCYNPNGATETCCLPDAKCNSAVCLEDGLPDSDCCGLEEATSCEPGHTKVVGDICWEANGARRVCCVPEDSAALAVGAEAALAGLGGRGGYAVACAFAAAAAACSLLVFLKRRPRAPEATYFQLDG